MKKLLIIYFTCLFIIRCGGGSDSVNVTDESVPPVIEEPNPTLTAPIKFIFHRDNQTFFYDYENIVTWKTGKSAHVGKKGNNHLVAHGTVIYELNDSGAIISQENIPAVPDLGVKENNNFWQVYRVSPDEAIALGYQYKNYTEIYRNNDEYGSWYNRQYYADRIVKNGTDIFILSEFKTDHINGSIVAHAVYSDLIIYDANYTTRRAYINGVFVSWSNNFFNNEKEWLFIGDGWMSARGYFFDGVTLHENGNRLTEWRTSPYPVGNEAPVLISAGVREVNGDSISYWIECNTGWMYSFNKRLNTLNQVTRLYNGDGTRDNGFMKKEYLRPVMSPERMLFSFEDGAMYEYNFTSGLIRYIYNSPVWVEGF